MEDQQSGECPTQYLRLGMLRAMGKRYKELHPHKEVGSLYVYVHDFLEPDVRMLPFFLPVIRRGIDYAGNQTELGHIDRFVVFTESFIHPIMTQNGLRYPVVMFDSSRQSAPLIEYVAASELMVSESAPPVD